MATATKNTEWQKRSAYLLIQAEPGAAEKVWKDATGWSARLVAEFIGSQTATGGAALPSYALWSASVGKQIALADQRKLVLRAGLENLGNLNLAQKSADFGYAERARRLFVSARVDF